MFVRHLLVCAAVAAPLIGIGCLGPEEAEPRRVSDLGEVSSDLAPPFEDESSVARGVLSFVNDAATTLQLLDEADGVGLRSDTAENIMAARPFDTLDALDDVYGVGPKALERLADYACNVDRQCQGSLHIATWNLEHFPLIASTVDAVPPLADAMGLDVIGIQEIEDVGAFETLVAQMDGYEGVLADPGPYTRVGIIYRTSAVELIKPSRLFEHDWYAFPRPVISAKFRLAGSVDDVTFTVAVVHLKASPGEKNEARRRDGVEKLDAWVKQEQDMGNDGILLMGDFNDRLTDPVEDNVFTAFAESDYQRLSLPAEKNGEFTLIPYKAMIDHVVVTNALLGALRHEQTEVVKLDETWSSGYEQQVSDHRPVMTSFGFAEAY